MISDSLLDKFSMALSLPLQKYRGSSVVYSGKGYQFTPNPAYFLMKPYIGGPHPVCFVVSPDYIFGGYIALPDCDEYLIVGPACPYEISTALARRLFADMGLPKQRFDELLLFLHHTPRMSSTNFFHALDFLNELIRPKDALPPVHLTYQISHIDAPEHGGFAPINDFYEAFEHTLCRLIRHGKTEEAAAFFDDHLMTFTQAPMPRLASNNLRSVKNTAISSTAVAARYAVSGGLDYRSAIMLSDYYIFKVEAAASYALVLELLRSMILDFTTQTATCRAPRDDSAIVQAVYRDVREHRGEKITSRQIADRLGISVSYLCHHFREKTGKTVTRYIHEDKVGEAKYLLENPQLSLVEISGQLGFSSQQRFHAVFREICGVTPGEYRNQALLSRQ